MDITVIVNKGLRMVKENNIIVLCFKLKINKAV